MAETSIRTCLLLAFFLVISAEASKVTFVGFLNDVQNKQFSALLELELSAEENAFNNLWLASKDFKSCTGRAVYGQARVDPEPTGATAEQYGSEIRTLQLLLPVLPDHEERTLYLCTRSGGRWKPLGSASEFFLPKVTDLQILNEENNEYILEPLVPAGM